MPSGSLLGDLRAGLLPGARADERDLRAHALRCERVVTALARSLPPRPDARVLEVGLGAGYVPAAIRARLRPEVELYAVEHPARALPADPGFDEYLERMRVAFAPADLLAGPLDVFPGVAFDAVVCSEVIEHLPPDRVPYVLGGLAARLAGHGVLVLTSPNLRSFHRRVSFALGSGRILDPPLPRADADGTYGHLRLYARDEVAELLADAALEPVAWEYVDFESEFVARRALRTAQRLAVRAVPSLASGWLAVARRREQARVGRPLGPEAAAEAEDLG